MKREGVRDRKSEEEDERKEVRGREKSRKEKTGESGDGKER